MTKDPSVDTAEFAALAGSQRSAKMAISCNAGVIRMPQRYSFKGEP